MPEQAAEQELSREEIFYGADESEPLEKPTEPEASEDPGEEDEALADESEAEEEASDESEEDEENKDTPDVYEINGKEYTLEDIESLEAGAMMQADYTKKTQAHAEEVKLFEVEKTKVSDLSAQLEVLVAEDEEIDWADLKEFEPEKYILQKEKADKRKLKLEEVKAQQAKPQQVLTQDELAAESTDFYAHDAAWLDDKKQLTPKFKDDMKIAQEYLQSSGYGQEEVNAIVHSHHWKTILSAAKYNAQTKKASALKKKVIKPLKVTKPKANNSGNLSAEEIFYGKK